MILPRKKGDQHVKDVYHGLQEFIGGQSINSFSNTTKETVQYIVNLYPNIKKVRSKFEEKHPDFNPDLQIILDNDTEIKINLFSIKNNQPVQPKNMGAKSFLKTYFLSETMQENFNTFLIKAHTSFLQDIVQTRENVNMDESISDLKKRVKKYFPKFADEIDHFRRHFLFSLREYGFSLLKKEFNELNDGIKHAFKKLLMLDSTNIVTRYYEKNGKVIIEELEFHPPQDGTVNIYKVGNDTIGIRCGEEAFTIRFKFESSPVSSIKLASGFKRFPKEDSIIKFNQRTISKFEKSIRNHETLETKKDSNAIGKCNEAIIYYQLLKNNLDVTQVDSQEFQEMLEKYSPFVLLDDLVALHQASEITIQRLIQYLDNKYDSFKIDSIQLVPDIYTKDRLNNTDLQLILLVNGKYIEEALSLKALSKRSTSFTVKNPGIGQILGPLYFDIGSLSLIVDETKQMYCSGKLNHNESLQRVSRELGERLAEASQKDLLKGVKSLLGTSVILITFYKHNHSIVFEHDEIDSEIHVLKQSPKPTQTTLIWNNHQEKLSLRVKFSRGQNRGWSSLKLDCALKLDFKFN